MFNSRRSLAIAVTVVLALGAACGEPLGLGPDGPGADGPEPPIEELPRPLTAGEAVVVARSNTFGIDLLREVLEVDNRTNVVLSPLSASMVLAMTLNGAAGTTLDGMRTALGLEGLSHAEINDSYGGLIGLLTDLDPLVEVSIANSAWANERYSFYQAFFDAVTDHFEGTVASRDFGDPNTLREINAWVDSSTRGLIERILQEGDLDPDHALLLLNAVYFDGSWRTGFDPEDTAPGPFMRADGSTVTVDMMHLADVELLYGQTDDLVAVELPYGGGAYSMFVALPWDGTPQGGPGGDGRERLGCADRFARAPDARCPFPAALRDGIRLVPERCADRYGHGDRVHQAGRLFRPLSPAALPGLRAAEDLYRGRRGGYPGGGSHGCGDRAGIVLRLLGGSSLSLRHSRASLGHHSIHRHDRRSHGQRLRSAGVSRPLQWARLAGAHRHGMRTTSCPASPFPQRRRPADEPVARGQLPGHGGDPSRTNSRPWRSCTV